MLLHSIKLQILVHKSMKKTLPQHSKTSVSEQENQSNDIH